ncbi:hypothetical protein [Pleionea sediminis]|uniref:hypothetical protein n=1 Tax=Pleionea sediminis TaxID=2569479 RepID=UPI001186786A|nr:hypothetical protein [Pleionea sediminis]
MNFVLAIKIMSEQQVASFRALSKGLALKYLLPVILMIVTNRIFAEEPVVEAALSSEGVYRGGSLSYEEPTASLSIDYNYSDSLFGGIGLFRHQSGGLFDQRGWQNVYAGFYSEFKNNWATSFSVSAYQFDADFEESKNYTEAQVDLHFRDAITISYAISDSYYGKNFKKESFIVNWHSQLNQHWFLQAELGENNVPDAIYQEDILFYSLSATYNISRWSFQILKAYSQRNAERAIGDGNAGGRWILSLSYQLY